MKNHHMERIHAIINRIRTGEFDNPITDQKHPATMVCDVQIRNLLIDVEMLMSVRDAILPKAIDPEWLVEEMNRIERFRRVVETSFGMRDHPKANAIWNMAWCMGNGDMDLENSLVIYSVLISLVE